MKKYKCKLCGKNVLVSERGIEFSIEFVESDKDGEVVQKKPVCSVCWLFWLERFK